VTPQDKRSVIETHCAVWSVKSYWQYLHTLYPTKLNWIPREGRELQVFYQRGYVVLKWSLQRNQEKVGWNFVLLSTFIGKWQNIITLGEWPELSRLLTRMVCVNVGSENKKQKAEDWDGFNFMINTSKGPSSETSKFYCNFQAVEFLSTHSIP
jgi:hypothetical protein